MEQLLVGALFIGSVILTTAAAKGMLGLLFHLMVLAGQSDRLAAQRRDPSPTL
jgi:hypothetical protein